MKNEVKILFFDIETSPILGYVWSLWEQNVGLTQIHTDWHVIACAAKWLGNKNIMYKDQRKCKDIENDKVVLQFIWNLLDQADIVVTQNGKKFDVKKLNARFIMHGMKPPSSYRHIDTAQIARKHFAFTSNKLEYLTDKLCTKYKKIKNSGFSLWKRCLAGELSAWKEMEKYNKYDVLSLEELYHEFIPWDNSINFNVYNDDEVNVCSCGSSKSIKNGFKYTNLAKYQRYKCSNCGRETRSRTNLLTKEKRASLKG